MTLLVKFFGEKVSDRIKPYTPSPLDEVLNSLPLLIGQHTQRAKYCLFSFLPVPA